MSLQDLRFAFRALRKAPTLTAAAVLTLALGIGLNTAIFSVVESVLLKRLPYRDPSRLVRLTRVNAAGIDDRFSIWTVAEWQRRSRTLDSVAMYDDAGLILVENGHAEALRGMRVTAGFFDTLGVPMFLGRTFLPEEDRAPRANALILTHPFWSQRFAADPAIVGRLLPIDGQEYRVVGILPPDFHPLRMNNPAETPQFFAPAGFDVRQAAACHVCGERRAIARLTPAPSANDAASELTAIARELSRDDPAYDSRDVSIRVDLLQDALVRPVRTTLWMSWSAVLCVLLIACANVASLQLVRANARSREFAVRTALGGARSRLIAQSLIENLVLAVIGGVAGVFVGIAATWAIAGWAPRELPRFDELRVDGAVLLFTLAMTAITGLVFGMVPAWSASRVDVNHALKSTGGVAGRSSGGRVRDALVVIDLALAFALVVVTGLLGRSVYNLRTYDAGFDPHNVLTMTPVIGAGERCGVPDRRLECYREIVERVRALPGVSSVGWVSNVPLSHVEPFALRIEGQSSLAAAESQTADVFWSSPDYFRVLGIPLKRGRFLTDEDGVSAPPAALISESLARARFARMDPIGRRIQIGPQEEGPWLVIVGIVGDVRYDRLDLEARPAVYQPQALNPFHYTRLAVRTIGDPSHFERAISRAILDVDPRTAVFHVQPMEDYVRSSLAARTFALTLIGSFGVLALLLSAIGVYGLISYSVTQRAAEIGVRAALGATRRQLFTLILRQGMTVLTVGLAVGLAAALAARTLLASSLFGLGRWDSITELGAAALLAAVVLLASSIGARAVTRIDPMTALRAE